MPGGGNGSQVDAWGGRGSPPDLGELFRQGKVQFGRMLPGGSTVDEVITIGRQEIETEALAKMRVLASKYVMGISIDQVQLKNNNPPQTHKPRRSK
jgi:hypothetical protein